MGCGCCEVTYLEEVEEQIITYINKINETDKRKNTLIKDIREDLLRRASTMEKYYYPYRKDDVDLTVNFYKNYIFRKFKGNLQLIEDKIKSNQDEKENNQENED